MNVLFEGLDIGSSGAATAVLIVVLDMLIDASPDAAIGILLAATVDANANIFAVAMSVLDFCTVSTLTEDFGCWAAFDCRPRAAVDRARVLQTWMPSCHVCRSLALPALPQSPDQEPARPQQLLSPDFAMAPHLGQTGLIAMVAGSGTQ